MALALADRLAALEAADPVLLNARNVTPAQLEARRVALRRQVEAAIAVEATSAAALAMAAADEEIGAFIELMRAKHGPDLAEIDQRRADAMASKAAALEEIRRLQKFCSEMDAIAMECAAHRIESAQLLAADVAAHHWTAETIKRWNDAADVCERVATALGLAPRPALERLYRLCERGRQSMNGFKAAIIAPTAINHQTLRQ